VERTKVKVKVKAKRTGAGAGDRKQASKQSKAKHFHTSFFYLALDGGDFLLLNVRGVWVETAEVVVAFPGQDAVGSGFVFRWGHFVLLHRGEVGVVCAQARRPGV